MIILSKLVFLHVITKSSFYNVIADEVFEVIVDLLGRDIGDFIHETSRDTAGSIFASDILGKVGPYSQPALTKWTCFPVIASEIINMLIRRCDDA